MTAALSDWRLEAGFCPHPFTEISHVKLHCVRLPDSVLSQVWPDFTLSPLDPDCSLWTWHRTRGAFGTMLFSGSFAFCSCLLSSASLPQSLSVASSCVSFHSWCSPSCVPVCPRLSARAAQSHLLQVSWSPLSLTYVVYILILTLGDTVQTRMFSACSDSSRSCH